MKFMLLVSKIVLNNRKKFPLKLLSRFKNIEVFVMGSFLLPHPVYRKNLVSYKIALVNYV